MSDIIKPGAGLIFMKVGTHANEGLEQIIARKIKEIADVGHGMWGYGGNTCHPRTMVQPFAEDFAKRGGAIHLCMEEMDSNHREDPLRAGKYSIDGIAWRDMPPAINVLGSRFALIIDDLRRERFTLPLHETRVAVGISQGRNGSRYVQGRADKACLEVIPASERPNDVEVRDVEIHLVATLRPPYAVFLSEEGGKVA